MNKKVSALADAIYNEVEAVRNNLPYDEFDGNIKSLENALELCELIQELSKTAEDYMDDLGRMIDSNRTWDEWGNEEEEERDEVYKVRSERGWALADRLQDQQPDEERVPKKRRSRKG